MTTLNDITEPEALSKLCRKNSHLEVKQDPQGLPVVSFYFCGWNEGRVAY